jgi:TRAP-type C4-dicarboxylate transport system permease large subunit
MTAKMAKILRGLLLTLALMLVANFHVIAQCPMCRMSLESNLKNGGSAGQGFNAGILLLLATPYLLVGGIAFVWFRNRKSQEDTIEMS